MECICEKENCDCGADPVCKDSQLEPAVLPEIKDEEKAIAEEDFDYKKAAIALWGLLDNIDTASDVFKPSDIKSWNAYYRYVNRMHSKRFKIFSSDGYDLFIGSTTGGTCITDDKKKPEENQEVPC
jgi:hypothetical protein